MVDITNNTVDSVARQLPVAAGTVGSDLVSLQHWMLRFGAASLELRQIVGYFGDLMVNGYPPWEDYRLLMPRRLIGIYKCPGVWPVRV